MTIEAALVCNSLRFLWSDTKFLIKNTECNWLPLLRLKKDFFWNCIAKRCIGFAKLPDVNSPVLRPSSTTSAAQLIMKWHVEIICIRDFSTAAKIGRCSNLLVDDASDVDY